MKTNLINPMKLKKYVLMLLMSASGLARVYAQGETPVNMYTGTPNIFISLYTLKDHDLIEPVSLAYSLSDLSLDGAHAYGVGWELTSGTQNVSRQVRGLPDDFGGSPTDARRGWLYNSNYAAILAFPNTSDLSAATCSDELADQTFIQGLGYLKDTEPDWFSFSVGNTSGHFMFGNDGNIHLVPYQDVKIVPAYANAPSDLTITGWTITTNDGVVYTLNEKCSTSTRLLKSTKDDKKVDQTMLSLFEREYRFYSNEVKYNAAWMLTTAQSPSGASLTYTYTDKESKSVSPRDAMIFDAQWASSAAEVPILTDFTLMRDTVVNITKTVSKVTASSGVWITFEKTSIKIYDPEYSSVSSFKEFLLEYSSGFLTSVTETDALHCNRMPPYRLYYNNQAGYPLVLPYVYQRDFWGYHNAAYNAVPGPNDTEIPTSVPTVYVYPDENGAEVKKPELYSSRNSLKLLTEEYSGS